MSESVKKGIKLTVIVLISAFIGILLGQLVTGYEVRYMLSREYVGEIGGIEIYRTKDADEENMSKHLEMLGKAPEKLTECCKRLYFVGDGIDLPMHDAGLGEALGLTQGSTVYVATGSFSSYVVFHELFHAYDNANGEISANSVDFYRLYNTNKQLFPVFASNEDAYASEYFAQAGAYYLLVPRELETASPDVYRYYDETLGFGK